MKKQKLFILLIFISGSQVYGQPERHTSIEQATWLVGNWQGTYNNAPFYEAWRLYNDSVLVNFNIEIKGSDTVVKESSIIRLLPNGRIIHASTNATWELSSLTDKEMVFVNDTLKFANRITWTHSADDHWLTEIQNPKGKLYYDMVRVPWLEGVVNRVITNSKRKGN